MTKRGRGSGRRSAQATDDAEEAMEDARAEVADVSAALETGESSAAAAGAPAPGATAAVMQRQSHKAKAAADKAKSDADKAIKEKEAMQKEMDEMRAALQLAKSKVGDTVQVADNPVSTPARKVGLVPLDTCFDLALNIDLYVMYLIQFCRRGRKQWKLPQF
jgi:type II secretory pathway component HofQ